MTTFDRIWEWLTIEAPFLVAVIGAAVVKVGLSAGLSWRQRLFTVATAVWAAWVFTAPLMDLLGLNPGMKEPLAALIALTAEGLARILVGVVSDRAVLLELLRAWRGR